MIKTQTQIFFFTANPVALLLYHVAFSTLSYLCVSQKVKWPRTRDRQDINPECIHNNHSEHLRIKVNEKRILRFDRSVWLTFSYTAMLWRVFLLSLYCLIFKHWFFFFFFYIDELEFYKEKFPLLHLYILSIKYGPVIIYSTG